MWSLRTCGDRIEEARLYAEISIDEEPFKDTHTAYRRTPCISKGLALVGSLVGNRWLLSVLPRVLENEHGVMTE